MREVAFDSFLGRYEGGSGIIVGKGPTEFDFRSLADCREPVIFINDAVCHEALAGADSYFFAHDARQLVWLGRIRSLPVLPVGERVVPHARHPALAAAPRAALYRWDYNGRDHNLELSREELAEQRVLYLHSGTIHAAIHFAWMCGIRAIRFVGCDGINEQRTLDRLGATGPYDPRIRNLSRSSSLWVNARIKARQVWLCRRLGLDVEYLGRPRAGAGPECIPRRAHFVWLDEPPPGWLLRNIEAFERLHPGWEVQLHREPDPAMDPDLQAAFHDAPRACMRSDILRYWVLHRSGGVYVDADQVVIRPLDELLGDELFLPEHRDGRVQNGLMGAAAGNEVLGLALREVVRIHAAGRAPGDRCAYGPTLWTRLRESTPFVVHPHHYFEPFHTRETAVKFWHASDRERDDMLVAVGDRMTDGVWPYAIHLKGCAGLDREFAPYAAGAGRAT